jgi:L-alanine-DL-glutamate epimerase-like enolase superfamily enzyme
MRVTGVRIAECPIPLPHVLRLGPIEITTRDYIAIRVETESNVFGEAIGYPRGTPLFETLGHMSRRILGGDASMRRDLMLKLELSNVPARAGLTRGLSLLDIALWDIAAKMAGQPLFRMLGGLRKKAQVTVVAGYYMDRRSISDVVDEVGRLADTGYQRVKIMLKGNDPDFDRRYASEVCDRLPGQIGADAHWSWSTLTEAKRLCRELDGLGLNFLEDPFAASDWRLTHELQRGMQTPIAAGEDVFGARAISDLVCGIDVLRVDATTCGGITGAIEAVNIAAAAGRTVLPHVFAPVHAHLACAFPNVEGVEVIPEESGADPLGVFLRDRQELKDGMIAAAETPGAGILLDWDAIERLARRVTSITPEA